MCRLAVPIAYDSQKQMQCWLVAHHIVTAYAGPAQLPIDVLPFNGKAYRDDLVPLSLSHAMQTYLPYSPYFYSQSVLLNAKFFP